MDFQNPNAAPDETDGPQDLNGVSGRMNLQASPTPGRGSVSRASSARPAANGT
jgi:histone deacetylase 1/2